MGMVTTTQSILPTVLDIKDGHGMTAVAWACAFGNDAVVRFAAKHSANMGCINKYSWNYAAIAHTNHPRLVETLVSLGAPEPGILTQKMKDLGIPMKS